MQPETRWDPVRPGRPPRRPRARPPLVVVFATVILVFAWIPWGDPLPHWAEPIVLAVLYPWSSILLGLPLPDGFRSWLLMAVSCVTWPLYLEIWCRLVARGAPRRRTADRIALVHAAAVLGAALRLILRS